MHALTISAHGGLDQITLRDDVPRPGNRAGKPDVTWIACAAAALEPSRSLRGRRAARRFHHAAVGARRRCDRHRRISGRGRDRGARRRLRYWSSTRESATGRASTVVAGEQAALPSRFGILGEHLPGTIAEYVRSSPSRKRSSDYLTTYSRSEQAAAFTLGDALTAWRMVISRARVQARRGRAHLGDRRRSRACRACDLQTNRRARLGDIE